MSGYLVSASGLISRISERFVEGQMSDEPGLSGAYLSRLSVCSDCFSDKHPFDVAPSHIRPSNVQRDTSTNGLVTGLFLGHCFFSPSGESSWLSERDVAGKMSGNHGTLLKSVSC